MSDSKISLLPVAVGQLLATDLFPVIRPGASLNAKLPQLLFPFVSVDAVGADPTGVQDSTAAILAASLSNGTTVFTSGGIYKVAALVLAGIHNMTWLGAGMGGVTLTTATPGTMVTMNNCNFNVIEGLSFQPTGTLANSTGLLLQTNTSNTTVRNCLFQLWTGAGMKCVGTVGATLSGNKIYDNYFLQCAQIAGVGQLDMTYNQDYFITHNQFGTVNTGTFGFPTYGVQANNCSNGQFDSNFLWTNSVGANFINCKYDRTFSNRFEQSQKEGVIYNTCLNAIFTGNWLNNNGNLTNNTYNDMRWITCARVIMMGNMFYSWNGVPPNTKYACSLETSCTQFTIKGNTANPSPAGYVTAAWLWDASITFTGMTTDGAMNFTSGATVAAGTSVFLGQGATNASSPVCARFLESTHTMVQLVVEPGNAPGAGQSYTYTLYKSGVATALSVTLSGAAAFQGAVNATTVIEDIANNASYTVLLTTSAGAAVVSHFAQVVFCGK